MNLVLRRMTWALLAILIPSLSPAATEAPAVRLLRTPEGGLQPDAVLDAQGTLHLVYLKGDPKACDVVYVRRLAGQTNFSKPLRVNSQPGSAIAVGTIRGAQLALGRNGRAHVAWNGSGRALPKPDESAPMLYSRLNDAGDAFEPQRNLVTATVHLDGGGSVAADARGNVFVIWHAGPKDGPRGETNRAVFLAASADDGMTFAPERPINPRPTGACACCALETFVDARGRLAVLYRSATAAGTRDLTALISDDGARTFKSILLDAWRVPTCPMSSMTLAQDAGDALLAAWETQGQVYQSTLRPGALEFAPRRAPAGGGNNRKHPVLASRGQPGGPVLMAWAVGTGWQKGGAVAWELVDATGQKTSGRADGLPVWGRPAVVAEADGAFTILY